MSFLSDISGFFQEYPIAGSLVTIAGLALVSKQLASNVASTNTGDTTNDTGVRQQLNASTKNNINVLYGDAYISGPLTDAYMSADAKTMYYCLTLSEKTGNLLSTGAGSTYQFKEIYWNDQRVIFQADGVTASYLIDKSGNVDRSIDGLVQIYCYAGNSSSQVIPTGYSTSTVTTAYQAMPSWTSPNNPMTNLIFAIIKVTYSSANNITGLANMNFRIANSLYLPGDVIYDYMTNTRYGAGIAAGDILTT